MDEVTPPPPSKSPALPAVDPPSIAESIAVFPASPSPSIVPEPVLAEPTMSVSVGVILLIIGIITAIVTLIIAIVVAGFFAVRSLHAAVDHTAPRSPPQPYVLTPTIPAAAPALPVSPPTSVPPPPAVIVPPAPPTAAPTDRGPFIATMSPDHGKVGDTVTLRGNGLAAVEDLILFPQHGGAFVTAAVLSAEDRKLTFAVPAVEKPDGFQPGDGYYLGAFAKTGAILFVDGTFHTADRNTGRLEHDAIRVRFADPFDGGDHLLVFGDAGARVSVGDSCVVLLRSNCTLSSYGVGCKIFYMKPLHVIGDPNADGVTEMSNIRVNAHGSRLMLTPLVPPGNPPDPNTP